jgi:hypothetical protein
MRVRDFQHLGLILAFGTSLASSLPATELRPQTAEGFQKYVQQTESRMQSELADPRLFLYIDTLPEKQKKAAQARLVDGGVLIEPLRTRQAGKEMEVSDGLVHHWLAVAFIPGGTLDQAMALAQDYSRHPQLYAPDVQRARVLSKTGEHFSVYFRFYRKAIVTTVYDTEFTADYFRPDAKRGYCISRAVRIAELENPGSPDEREYPIGNDHGYMWRLNLYTRFIERDQGVYIQIEFLALSRTVPVIFAWLVNPYVRSIPREYLSNYMVVTRKALSEPPAVSGRGARVGADAGRTSTGSCIGFVKQGFLRQRQKGERT